MTEERCWMCGGHQWIDKRETDENPWWSDATGGEGGKRWPVYSLHAAPGAFRGELIACPFCKTAAPSGGGSESPALQETADGLKPDLNDPETVMYEAAYPSSGETADGPRWPCGHLHMDGTDPCPEPVETPSEEVRCETCGHDHVNDYTGDRGEACTDLSYDAYGQPDTACECRSFKPVEPTPVEASPEEWEREEPGTIVWGRSAVMWRRSDGVGVRVPLAVEERIARDAEERARAGWEQRVRAEEGRVRTLRGDFNREQRFREAAEERATQAEGQREALEAVLRRIAERPLLPGPHSDRCQCSIHQARRASARPRKPSPPHQRPWIERQIRNVRETPFDEVAGAKADFSARRTTPSESPEGHREGVE